MKRAMFSAGTLLFYFWAPGTAAILFAMLFFSGPVLAKSAKCVGACYGAISSRTYKPRTEYVKPSVRRGRYVQPYTRSR